MRKSNVTTRKRQPNTQPKRVRRQRKAKVSLAVREARLGEFASRQRGMFTIAQSIECGVSSATRQRRVAAGLYEVVAPHVLRCGIAKRLDWIDIQYAQFLSARAIACDASAAALYGLVDPPDQPETIVPRTRRNTGAVVARSSRDLPRSDLAVVHGMPATNPIRTIIGYADHHSDDEVRRLITRAASRQLIKMAPLERRARELVNPARPGAAKVLALVAQLHPDLDRARNEWEARVVELSDHFGLPRPEINLRVTVDGHIRYLDVAWPDAKVFVEFDGYGPHLDSRETFDDDRDRQNALVDGGWLPFRITSTLARDQADKEFARIARAIRRRLRDR